MILENRALPPIATGAYMPVAFLPFKRGPRACTPTLFARAALRLEKRVPRYCLFFCSNFRAFRCSNKYRIYLPTRVERPIIKKRFALGVTNVIRVLRPGPAFLRLGVSAYFLSEPFSAGPEITRHRDAQWCNPH